MLEGVDRLVDLIGLRTSGLSGASAVQVRDAIHDGDVAALAATDGHFAGVSRNGKTVRLARTIGLPLRYFIAKMYHGPFLVVADRIDTLFAWCQEQRIAWQFDPAYTRMVPAHYLVEIDQVGCPDPMPRYRRFFEPPVGTAFPGIESLGAAYVGAAAAAVKRWIAAVPDGEPIAVAFSGGVDSTSVLLLARHALAALGRDPDAARAFTLDLGGGEDAVQARDTVRALGIESRWECVRVPAERYRPAEAIDAIEDYHPLDVECAAAALCLLRGIRERYPTLRYLLDGDGGDENLKAYPLEDSDLTLSSLLRNPLLYQEGWGIDAVKHSLTYSGGLSRGVRTDLRAGGSMRLHRLLAVFGALGHCRRGRDPFEQLLNGDAARLATLKQDVVRAGMRAVAGIDMPANPKRRFQDGAQPSSGARITRAWCRKQFERRWDERMRTADELEPERRSGNETVAAF